MHWEKKVFVTSAGPQSAVIDPGGLAKSVYFLKVILPEGTITKKIVLEQ